jgi:hypothetical protein
VQGGDFSALGWVADTVAAIEVPGTKAFEMDVDPTKDYLTYINQHVQSFTADAGTDVITANAHGLLNGETLRFKGSDLPGGLAQITVYYVRDVTTNTFKVAATSGGAAINLTDAGSGTMTFTAPSKRSIADDETDGGSIARSSEAILTGEAEESLIAAIKADADLGTGVNGAVTRVAATLTEVGKIHRSSTAVAAGASMRRTKVAATSSTIDETLGPTP